MLGADHVVRLADGLQLPTGIQVSLDLDGSVGVGDFCYDILGRLLDEKANRVLCAFLTRDKDSAGRRLRSDN